MKLSLCVIAGNVERYIERFLDAFTPLADEIVLVRATGNQPPDQTLAIARRRGCKTGIYSNTRDWPHVDDFAAARNLSFSMASHELIMWADTDDIIAPESIAAIRDAISRMPENCVGIEIPYQVPEDGITVWRERIIRAGAATWVSPIHEHLSFSDDAQLARLATATILHAATGERKSNDERNLRILESIPPAERTGSHRFHLFQSLRATGRLEDASAEVVSLLQDPHADIGQAERYELFIAAAQMSPDHAVRAHLMLQAVSTDPSRREAYGELALCMIGQGRPADALAYTTAMRSLKGGNDWNTRKKYAGWLGESLHGMGLRALGRIEEADATERNHFIRHGARISLLHATRGRVRKAAACRRQWLESAADPDAIEHIFALDLDDPEAMLLTVHNHVMMDGGDGPVAAWNAAAGKSAGAVLIQLSDDWEPFQGWDTAILNAIGDTSKPAVLAVSDGHRTDDLLCMAILTRARYQQQGTLFCPEFFSMFSDNWFSDCAFRDGVVIDARDRITFEHVHPAFGKGEMDATYARSNDPKNYQLGFGTYRRLRDGILTPSGMDGWCDYRPLYYAIAELLPENAGKFVEIGSWMGQSAVTLCQRLQDLGKEVDVYCVDTFAGEQNQPAHLEIVASHGGSIRSKFEGNIKAAGVDEMINIMQGDSAASAECFPDGYFDAVFIDAAHDYDSVVKDLAAWFPKVSAAGILAGHDYPCADVKRAVDEHAAAHGWTVSTLGRCWIRKIPKP